MSKVEKTVVHSLTESVCPICLRTLKAERVVEGDNLYLRKTCPEHGEFKTVIWRGVASYDAWGKETAAATVPVAPATEVDRGCPFDCGLCPDHRQQSCCVLVEVTARCNLSCPICFAGSGGANADLELGEIRERFETLKALGHPVNIQLSGGEPTVRDDLPDIVAMARDMGFEFVQINTNGIRLAREESYAKRLKDAGLDCVFLQFDGVSDDVYRAIRGTDLFELKVKAIDNCSRNRLGVVLVPVLVPGVNTGQIGDIIRFAAARSPHIRTIHFQPISYFGRYPSAPRDEDRITIPEVLDAIENQMGRTIKATDFRPGTAENPYCSFNGDFLVGPGGALTPSTAPKASSCCGTVAKSKPSGNDEVERARRFVARRWSAPGEAEAQISDDKSANLMHVDSLIAFLEAHKKSLVISGMAFQDAWTLDLERLRQCYIHITTPDGRRIPLCAFNLSSMGGDTLYRQGALVHERR